MKGCVAAAALLVCSAGCVPDPKVDPCRQRPASCAADATSGPDAGHEAGTDGQVVMDAEAGAAEAGISDAGAQPHLDAEAGVMQDASGNLDAGIRDASRPPREAGSDAGPRVLTLAGDLGVHDPAVIEADGTFTIIATGRGLSVKRSSDLLTWTNAGRVFATNPAWIAQEVPGATDLWAPDIAYFAGAYHLYYSASTFGSRNSCIGHAVATSLASLNFVDQGPVVCTEADDDYNAIDPAFVVDESGEAWLSFGSFWSGIKLIPLDANGQREGSEMYSLASRDSVEAVEAPYIVRHEGYYYLFVSFDICCRGASSTYRIMVGRSESVTGPYFDAEGKPMLSSGGGSMVVVGNQRWRGPGHNAVLTVGDEQYLVYHAYDADFGGAPTLRIAELHWQDTGWPVPVGP